MKLKQALDVASHFAPGKSHRQTQNNGATAGTSQATDHRLARALGWFSIGLGLAEIFAPRHMATLAGISSGPALVRSFGMREIGAGIGILSGRETSRWLWSRVAGDGTDLAVLAQGLTPSNRRRGRATIALAAVAGVTLLDIYCARRLAR